VESGKVRAGERDGLRSDLVVERYEGFGMAPDGARVLGNHGSVLMVDDAQLERVSVVRANVVVGSSVRVHWLAMRGMLVEWLVE
jgi:hypothetical protein